MLIYLAAGFAAGAFTYDAVSLKMAVAAAAVICAAGLFILLFKKNTIGIALIAASVAFAAGNVRTRVASDESARELYRFIDSYCDVTARVLYSDANGGEIHRYVVRAESIVYGDEVFSVDERIILSTENSYTSGQRAVFTCRIMPIDAAMNEYGFDAGKYYKSQGIYFRAHSVYDFCEENEKLSLITSLKVGIKNITDTYVHGDKGAILKAVLLGDKSDFSESFDDVLLDTGIRRYFYQAYVHIMLIMILLSLTAYFIPKKYRDAALIILLMLYGAYNSQNPICLKSAFLAAGTVVFARIFKFRYKPDVIALCMLVFLISSPMLIFNGGFMSGIMCTCMIYMFSEPLSKKLGFIKNSKLRKHVCVSLICTFFAPAVQSLYYNSLTPYNLIFGMLCIPLVVLILIFAPIMLLMLAVFGAAPVAEQICAFGVYSYLKLPYLIERLPFHSINIPTMSYPLVAANIFAIWCVYRHIRHLEYRPLFVCALAAIFLAAANKLPMIGKAEIDFVNIGQGDAAVISIPFRSNILIDGGGGTEYSSIDPAKTILLPYLASHGKTKIDAAFISHFHKDHAEGVIRAVEKFRVLNVYAPVCTDDNVYKQQLEETAKKTGTKINYIAESTRIEYKNGLNVEIIAPDPDTAEEDENASSLMIHVAYGEFDCLFTGDMTIAEQKYMLDIDAVPQCEILKVAHHGSRNSSDLDFNTAVAPKYAIISLGEENVHGFPHKEAMDNLEGIPVLRTDINGDIRIIGERNGEYKIKCRWE